MSLLDAALVSLGLLATSIVADGQLHRCGTKTKPRSKNGWYIIYDGGKSACFGNWEQGDGYQFWREDGAEFAPIDYQRIEAMKAARAASYEAASIEATEFFESCAKEGYSDYLKNKRCYPHGARFDGKTLIIPAQDANGKIWSYQKISGDGSKYFMAGGRMRGCYFPIFPARNIAKDELVVMCEGFATGATIHQETGLPVIVAFNAGNLKAVCETIAFRNLLIAADNDTSGVGEKAAKETGYNYVMPKVEGWDYNDVFLNGKDLKGDFISPSSDSSHSIISATGLVGEIADWITKTAVRPQPMLSLAAALSFVAMLKGHRVRGGTDLRANLLIMSLAPTGAGKEHPQYCIRKLSDLCGLKKHMMGEPVSGGGFLTGLSKADRVGLLIMDEMGRYLGNISNKNAGTHQREIVDYMVKSFSCASSTLKGRQYVDDKKNPCIDISQPHFCCLGSTVAERLQAACGSAEIVDGFLNRWLVFNVTERPKRQERARVAAPPDSIINKVKQYMSFPIEKDIYGEPEPKEVNFTPEAWDLFIQFRDKIDLITERAPYPMDKLYSRSAEHAEKIALVLCDDDFIGVRDIEFAVDIVEMSNKAIMSFAGMISDNASEQDFIRVRDKIKDAGEIQRAILTSKCQFVQGGARRIGEIVQVLLDTDTITERKQGSKVFYKWIG